MPDSLLFYAYFVLWVKGRAEADKGTWTCFIPRTWQESVKCILSIYSWYNEII
jgi:hypothetical protein